MPITAEDLKFYARHGKLPEDYLRSIPTIGQEDGSDRADRRSDAEILRQRFLHDICLDCGRDESGHEVERDRWGEPVVRCVWRGYYVEV